MPSPDSNRDNAKHSTGPRSTKGKQASALNSTKHGLRAQFTFANPGYGDEEKQKYARLVDALTRELDPQGVLETALVCQIAQCRIRLDRAMKCENAEVEKK